MQGTSLTKHNERWKLYRWILISYLKERESRQRVLLEIHTAYSMDMNLQDATGTISIGQRLPYYQCDQLHAYLEQTCTTLQYEVRFDAGLETKLLLLRSTSWTYTPGEQVEAILENRGRLFATTAKEGPHVRQCTNQRERYEFRGFKEKVHFVAGTSLSTWSQILNEEELAFFSRS
ncbi:hypothetical protein Tco_0065286 [Tanacetum coccineum]